MKRKDKPPVPMTLAQRIEYGTTDYLELTAGYLGALDAPAQVLDKVSAASNGDAIPSGDLLPFVPEPSPKLVLPNKRTNFDYRQLGDEGYTAAQCWNDAIDEVTRLNRS